MTIKDRINADFTEAYKTKDMVKKNFLGVVKGAIQTQESKPDFESNDTSYIKVLKTLKKGITESLEAIKTLGNDTSEQEFELAILSPYIPEAMSEYVIREKVRLIILEAGNKNVGFLMGMFNKQNAGVEFDNKVVSKIILEEIK